jgi:hypothetical protein
MPWGILAAYDACLVGTVWAAYALSGSNLVQMVWMLVFIFGTGPLVVRLPKTGEYPLAPSGETERPILRLIIWAVGFVTVLGVSLGLQWLLYRGLARVGIYPGQWTFFCLGFLIPLQVLGNAWGRRPSEAGSA